MKSERVGANTSAVEVTNVSPFGLWLLAAGREYFLAFENFPWFRDAPIGFIFNVEMAGEGHFYWPDLDVDLNLACIQSPEAFPLVDSKFD